MVDRLPLADTLHIPRSSSANRAPPVRASTISDPDDRTFRRTNGSSCRCHNVRPNPEPCRKKYQVFLPRCASAHSQSLHFQTGVTIPSSFSGCRPGNTALKGDRNLKCRLDHAMSARQELRLIKVGFNRLISCFWVIRPLSKAIIFSAAS